SWKLKDAAHSPPEKVRRNISRESFESIRYSRPTIPHAPAVRASRLSPARGPHGIHIPSVRPSLLHLALAESNDGEAWSKKSGPATSSRLRRKRSIGTARVQLLR